MRYLAPIARDVAGLVGLGLVVAGVDGWSRPAALVVAGILLVAGVFLSARRG